MSVGCRSDHSHPVDNRMVPPRLVEGHLFFGTRLAISPVPKRYFSTSCSQVSISHRDLVALETDSSGRIYEGLAENITHTKSYTISRLSKQKT